MRAVRAVTFPLRGVATRSMRCRAASSARADGVVLVHKEILSELDHHPVRSTEDASRYFIEVADTPPRRACPSNVCRSGEGVNELARASPLPLGEDGRRPGEGKIRHVSSVPSPERAKNVALCPLPEGEGFLAHS